VLDEIPSSSDNGQGPPTISRCPHVGHPPQKGNKKLGLSIRTNAQGHPAFLMDSFCYEHTLCIVACSYHRASYLWASLLRNESRGLIGMSSIIRWKTKIVRYLVGMCQDRVWDYDDREPRGSLTEVSLASFYLVRLNPMYDLHRSSCSSTFIYYHQPGSGRVV
jgi:hypothetical protein